MGIFDLFRRTPDIPGLKGRDDRATLEKLLSHKSAYYRWRALIALVSLARHGEYDAALEDFVSRDEEGSLRQLGDFLGYQSEPGVRVLAIDGIAVNYGLEWAERADVVAVLARLARPAALPLLVHALHDQEWFVREAAARGVSRLPYEPSRDDGNRLAEPLAALLRDPRYATRFYAVEALGRFGDSRVFPSIQAIAKDTKEDPDLRRAASGASARIKARAARERA